MANLTEKDLKEIASSLENDLLQGDGSMDIFEVVNQVWKQLVFQNQMKQYLNT